MKLSIGYLRNVFFVEKGKLIYEFFRENSSDPRSFSQRSKLKILSRYGLANSVWIETGTYRGTTTASLSKMARKVYSIEASDYLFKQAQFRFRNHSNVVILHGESPSMLKDLLPTLTGTINFWLDAHYSSGNTYKGIVDSPLVDELRIIFKYLAQFDNFRIFIDDAFYVTTNEYLEAGYPSMMQLDEICKAHNLSNAVLENIIMISRAKK